VVGGGGGGGGGGGVKLWGGMFVCCSFWCNIVSNHSVAYP